MTDELRAPGTDDDPQPVDVAFARGCLLGGFVVLAVVIVIAVILRSGL